MTPSEEKKQLRQTLRAREQALTADYRQSADAAILSHILSLPLYQEAKTVFCFVSTSGEIDTHPLLRHALERGKQLCVPRCLPGRQMALCEISSLDILSPSAYGILEPPESCPRLSPLDVDFALIPCLSCDRQGRRLGKGGGYYDRFLSLYRGGMAVVCREALLCGQIPMEPHDVSIPWVITEAGIFPGKAASPRCRRCLD